MTNTRLTTFAKGLRRHQTKMEHAPIARSLEAGRKLWQRSFFDHAVRKQESLHKIACYIWENPIRAKIIDEPTQYCWSGSEVWPNWREIYNKG